MFRIRTLVAVLTLALIGVPVFAQPVQIGPTDTQRFRELVRALEPAAFVAVRLADGTRLKGTILASGEDTFVLKRHARMPEPARDIRYDVVVSLERARQSMNSGTKVLVSVGASIGAFMLIMLQAVAIND